MYSQANILNTMYKVTWLFHQSEFLELSIEVLLLLPIFCNKLPYNTWFDLLGLPLPHFHNRLKTILFNCGFVCHVWNASDLLLFKQMNTSYNLQIQLKFPIVASCSIVKITALFKHACICIYAYVKKHQTAYIPYHNACPNGATWPLDFLNQVHTFHCCSFDLVKRLFLSLSRVALDFNI